jgi:thymidylate synthase ThyX
MSLNQIKVELCSWWGGDRDAANAAWASSTDIEKLAGRSPEDVARVLASIVANGHDTPKERVWLEFHITCPIFVERQFDKYRMTQQMQDFSVEYNFAPMGRDHITQNELSGRYRTIPDRPYGLPVDVAKILVAAQPEDMPLSIQARIGGWEKVMEEQHDYYRSELRDLKAAQEAGKITNDQYKRAREVLRGLLGTAFLTDMRVILNLNAFEHIINQRLPREAQLESRVVAYWMIKALQGAQVAPQVVSAMVAKHHWDNEMATVEYFLAEDVALNTDGVAA